MADAKKKVFLLSPWDKTPKIKEFCEKYDVTIGDGTCFPLENREKYDAVAWKGGPVPCRKEEIDALTNCVLIANHGAGYDRIDEKYAAQKGIYVTNTPGVVGAPTADIAMAHLLNISRRFSESERAMRSEGTAKGGMWRFMAHSLQGKLLGVIGMGSIGQQLAKRALAFDLKILYYCRNQLDKQIEERLGLEYVTFEDLLKRSDYISVNVPSNPATRHLLGAKEFASMKDGVYVINTARGDIIDEAALVDALKSGKVAGAGLDVYENEPNVHPELFTFPNVSLTPHIGTATYEDRRKMEEIALEEIERVLNGQLPVNVVNAPNPPRVTLK